ncbi:MAG TPA: hypothetical protein VLA16_06965, partial [Ideonella sp.]|nr:hypothetical protein [Ideonella sp.]
MPSFSQQPALQTIVPPLRCFIVEDSPVIRENLIATLEEMVALKVVGMAEDEEGAVRWLRSAGSE